ncbi:hypothetical protein [Nonomuraea typhae]|uniref:hypothetical protein n=1 Tax=Nonomuraea typhae TaxID=2603600 RepID=UPI0012F9BD7C|nr:hypothetical protein [Nonomuraea typhae]
MAPKDWKRKENWLDQDNLIYGGFIAIGIVLVQPFLTVSDLDAAALVCVLSFSVAIPLLAVLTMINQLRKTHQFLGSTPLINFAKGLGQAASVVGVVAAFWHMSWIAGVVLLVSGGFAVIAYGGYFAILPREMGGEGIQTGEDAIDQYEAARADPHLEAARTAAHEWAAAEAEAAKREGPKAD